MDTARLIGLLLIVICAVRGYKKGIVNTLGTILASLLAMVFVYLLNVWALESLLLTLLTDHMVVVVRIIICLALYAILSALIGARLYYVVFNWDYYSKDLTQILNVREGGLAIYGGVIAAIISVYIMTKCKKLEFGLVADTAGPALILGQSVGRWGNFFNREAFGGYTDGLLAMQLPISAVRKGEITEELWAHSEIVDGITYIQVHPTFLYESLWNFCLLISLLIYWKHRKFNGEIFLLYLFGYGVGRFWIESLRTDQLILPVVNVPVSMVVAAIMAIGAFTWIFLKRMQIRKNGIHAHE